MPSKPAKQLHEDGAQGNQKLNAVPKLAGTSKLFVHRILQFFVATAIGLAPFLGKLSVPGFSALLEIFPLQLQSALLPLSSVLMGVIVVTTDFLIEDGPLSRKRSRKIMFSLVAVAGVGLLGLLTVHTLAVAQVSFSGGAHKASFMIGFPPHEYAGPDCPKRCVGLSSEACIEQYLGLEPTLVTTCFGEAKVSSAKLVYALLYLCVMGSLAAMVGVGILAARRKRAGAH